MTTRTCATWLAALAICGCATSKTPPPNTASAAVGSSTCLTSTGSRIPPGPDSNCTAWGRSYSQTDIDQTGKTSAAGALRNLDPSLTITH